MDSSSHLQKDPAKSELVTLHRNLHNLEPNELALAGTRLRSYLESEWNHRLHFASTLQSSLTFGALIGQTSFFMFALNKVLANKIYLLKNF